MHTGTCPVSFGVLFGSVVLGCRYILKILDRAVSGASFFTWGGVRAWHCTPPIRGNILCMLYKIWCNPMHPLYSALPMPYVPVRVKSGALAGTLMCLLAAEPRWTPVTCIPCQFLRGTILVTPYSMVWDWRVFYLPSCRLPFFLLVFSLSFLKLYGFVLWAWGLRSNRQLITLSQPCSVNLFNNNNNNHNNTINWKRGWVLTVKRHTPVITLPARLSWDSNTGLQLTGEYTLHSDNINLKFTHLHIIFLIFFAYRVLLCHSSALICEVALLQLNYKTLIYNIFKWVIMTHTQLTTERCLLFACMHLSKFAIVL